MAACDNFVEQLWRKGKCANCFFPKETHQHDSLENIGEDAACISNYEGKRSVIQPQSQSVSHIKLDNAFSVERSENVLKRELMQSENTKEKPELAIAPDTTGNENHGKTDQNFKLFVTNKPKPTPKPRPRPFSRVGESTFCVKSREENGHKSPEVNGVNEAFENSLGKSQRGAVYMCNASSLESSEAAGFSIPAYNDMTNNDNIKTVFETILSEELEEDTSLDINMNFEDESDKNICLPENDEPEAAETDLSKLKIEDSEDDNDAYVPMRSSIALFVGEPIALQSEKTDAFNVVRGNTDKDGVSLNKSDRVEKVVMSCHFDAEKSATYVSEFKNPLFKITDDMGSAQSGMLQEPVERGKLSPCTKEPVYENRPVSISSDASSGRDSGYENIRKSTRSNSSTSTSGNATDVDSNVKTPDVDLIDEISLVGFSGPESSIESSGTSCSSWGSSTWDSCSETSSDCHKAGTEFLLARNHGDKPHIKGLGIRAATGRSYFDVKDDQRDHEHVYLNADAKPMTRPYKVVDISTGLLVPATENQTELPPLPPKEKDLRKDTQEKIVHEYLEPCEEVKGIPEQPLSTKGPPSVPDMCPVPSPSFSTAPSTIPDKSSPVRRAPAPRPRSRVPSQFGTLPKPAPRLSKVLGDVPVKVEPSGETNQKMVTQPTVSSKALDDIPPPCPPSLGRLPSLKKSSQTTAPPSLPSPQMSTPESNRESSAANKPPENTPLSPARDEDDTVGEALEGPIKPKRSAPPPPPLAVASSPPPNSSGSQLVEPSSHPSPIEIQPIQASAGPGSNNSSASPKASSPKSTIRRALKSMKKFGSKKKNKHSKTIEISGPIVLNDEASGFLAQRGRSESTPPAAQRISRLEPIEPEVGEACSSPVIVPTSSPTGSSSMGSPTPEPTGERSSGPCSPIMPTQVGMGYQNFPLSKGSDTLERPKKPPRLAKVVKPLQHTPPTAAHDLASQVDEEPTYLQPNEDELTLKVEVALANLNDAELLAEALSRVEQEKLGPLPAIPRSRHVHFRGKVFGDSVEKVSFEKPQLPRRPVRVVSPTLINGEKSESKCRPPKLPSRPPNTKPAVQTMRERSHSLERGAIGKPPGRVARSRSLSSSSNILERRYNKILKLQLQTLEDMLNCWREELLPHEDLDLSDTRWSDYEICGGLLDVQCPGAVLVPVKCAKFWEGNKKLLAKVYYPILCTSQTLQRSPLDMRICEALPYHVNVSRVLTHFTDHVSGDTIGRLDCDSYETLVSISDQLPCETVADFSRRTTEEHDNDPEKYEKKVCLLLLQLLNALNHLQREAVVHRDLKVENLFLLDRGLLLVANFEHALQQDKSTQPSPFILSTGVSSRYDGNLEHLPPEIFNAPEDADTLNYEECDSFAAGCLVYELLHRPNPFAANPHLIEQKYHENDLPPLPVKSRFSKGLDSIARQLLLRHPQERLSVVEAIQMIQALLWGPEDLEDDHLENVVGDWLETERAHTVATIARNQRSYSFDEFMETYLKCQFLVDGTEEVIIYNYNQLKK